MPGRWIICPVVTEDVPGWGALRYPKVSRMTDPGRKPKQGQDENGNPISVQPTFQHTSIVSDGLQGQINDWCISFVFGADLTPVLSDSEIVDLFEEDSTNADNQQRLKQTAAGRGWDRAKIDRVVARLRARGTQDLREKRSLAEWLDGLAAIVNPGSRTENLRVTERVD